PLRVLCVAAAAALTWLLVTGLTGTDTRTSALDRLMGPPGPRPFRPRFRCGLPRPCPRSSLAFRLVSGAANVIGPRICLDGRMLMSSGLNNVGRGLNIALVNAPPPHRLTEETRRLFVDLGSAAAPDLGFRDSWVFVGAKGVQDKSPFEQHVRNSRSSNKYEGWPEAGLVP
ncbi:family with sequence similarity 3, member A, partial [Columba livia]